MLTTSATALTIYAQPATIEAYECEIIPLQRNANTYENREAWLYGAIRAMRPIYATHGYNIPDNLRVAIGWCSTGRNSKAIGECWASEVSADGTFEIFLKATLTTPFEYLEVLSHELIHAIVGLGEKHGGKFKQIATDIGLEGKMTATHAGPNLASTLKRIAEELGPLPHAALTPMTNGKKKQTTRLLKAVCRCGGDDMEYIVRISRKALDERGAPICPDCMERMKVDLGTEPEETETE